MMVGRVFLVLTGACQFIHGAGGFATNLIHSICTFAPETLPETPRSAFRHSRLIVAFQF